MNGRIGIISLGCSKNLVNTEQMMFLLRETGFDVTGETDGVDAVVLNTCGFIESAKMEAIETILELGQAKKVGRIGKIIIAGCLPERHKDEIMSELPEIDAVVGTGSFDDIVCAVNFALNGAEKFAGFGDINAPISEVKRIITTSTAWAYLKVADGCDNRCAYCVIPDIRGAYRSRPIENIINEAQELVATGIKELILVAQDVTNYGSDLYGKRRLKDLLSELSCIENLKWIRLHYLYPDEIDDELIDLIAKNDKILKYLDIPIQHINDAILKKMNRRGTGGEIRTLFKHLRECIPNLVLRTSIIAGLPGEGESEFEDLAFFLKEAKIERAGVFRYSPEEGSPAAQMERPDSETAAWRVELLENIQTGIMDEYNQSRIGTTTEVLIEGYEGDYFYGRTYAESPDVDGYVLIEESGLLIGEIYNIRFTGTQDGQPVGEIC
jgi:ribosomal protein S12 methylthiotransferase